MPKPSYFKPLAKPSPKPKQSELLPRKQHAAPVDIPGNAPPVRYAQNMLYAAQGHPNFSASQHVKALAELVIYFANSATVDKEWVERYGARADVPTIEGPAYLSMYDPDEDYFKPIFGSVAPFYTWLEFKYRDGSVKVEKSGLRTLAELDRLGIIGWRRCKSPPKGDDDPAPEPAPRKPAGKPVPAAPAAPKPKPVPTAPPKGKPALAPPEKPHKLKPQMSRLFTED